MRSHLNIVLLLYSFVSTFLADLLFVRFPPTVLLEEPDNLITSSNSVSFAQRNVIGKGENAVVYSVAPKVPQGTALTDEDGYLYERLSLWSPLGFNEVVVKVFSKLKKDATLALCDGETIVMTCIDEEDAKSERKHLHQSTTMKKVYLKKDDTSFFTTEFVNETLVHATLSTLLHLGLTPHIACLSFATVRPQKDNGYLLIERLDTTLGDLLDDEEVEDDLFDRKFDCDDIAVIYFQFLHTLYVCQNVFDFKHHDLHPDNVFITCITDEMYYRGQRLCDYEYFKYTVEGDDYYLPNRGFLVKFADFGLSSLSAGRPGHRRRIGRIDIDVFNNERKEWGVWNNEFARFEGYDAQFFFTDPPYGKKTRFHHSKKLNALFRLLKQTATTKHGKNTKEFKRPRVVSQRLAKNVLNVFKHPAESFYDFTRAPTGGRVLVMGQRLKVRPNKKRRRRKEASTQVKKKPGPFLKKNNVEKAGTKQNCDAFGKTKNNTGLHKSRHE